VEGGDTLHSRIDPQALLPLPRVIEVLYQSLASRVHE
jgi:hypothetical protein